METKTNKNDQKNVEEISENLEGVSFSDGNELGNAVSDVSHERGFFATIKRMFKKQSTSLKKTAQ